MNIEEKPIWKKDLEKSSFPKLEKNLTVEVAIIGGGLAGILTAYLLVKSGKKVVLLEKEKIGSGATEYTTAFITQAIDTDSDELVSMFGEEKTRLVWQSGADAIDLIEKIVLDEKIDCGFMRTNAVVFANSDKEYEKLQNSYQAESELGFDITAPVQDVSLNFRNYGYYEIKNQAKFHPLKFLTSLARIVQDAGARIFEHTEVTKINHPESSEVTVEAGEFKINADRVVIATYQPFNHRIRLFLKRGMYRSFAFALKLPKNLIQEGLYWDKANPYHYFRIDAYENYDQMILGGEDLKSMFKIDKEKSFGALEDYLKQILPGINYEITNRWIGPILEPSDGLPLIGQASDREYVATAFSGNGMTYSAVAAMIFHDLITGYQNIYTKVYDPRRIPSLRQLFIKGEDYFEEFFGGAAKNVFRKKTSAT